MNQIGPYISSHGLDLVGIDGCVASHWNYGTEALYEAALERKEVRLAKGGAIVANTRQHTGRSPNDKYTVEEDLSKDSIWWGKVNVPIAEKYFDQLHSKVVNHLKNKELFIQDCWSGADKNSRLPVRIVTEQAWHNLFARNMFIQPSPDELPSFNPGFTVIQAPSFDADPEVDGTRSKTFIIVSLKRRIVLIGGTSYAGEIKKSIFGVMNYLLPERGIMPMHCSANTDDKGNSAIFFGLSGTGKTTLSADSSRILLGDDEHGWGANGIFNFEGGCYAKVINLSAQAEPEIYSTVSRFGTILENVVMDDKTRVLDLDDSKFTENTRASYPLEFIPNVSLTGLADHPKHIIMLTADAFGVLPPISKLTPAQAIYHFLSGYTARVAGTEKGLGSEPQATFSTCFGAPFMPRHPTVYADLLGQYLKKYRSQCWLVNTGWTGGAYGVGSRMSITYTRAMLRAALDGRLAVLPTRVDHNFGLHVPLSCPDVPSKILDPRQSWSDKAAYDTSALDVAHGFEKNFEQYNDHVDEDVKKQAICAA